MDPKFQALPPLKRFTVLQQEQEQQSHHNQLPNPDNLSIFPFQLPTKKRKHSREPLLPESDPTCFLPTKKRVWALHPDFISGKPLTPFDLNLDYFPAPFGEPTESIPTATAETNITPESPLPFIPNHSPSGTTRQINENIGGNGEVAVVDDDDDGVVCAICGSTDGDPTDPIVFCDGCELMVHATCYGNPLIKGIPEGEWVCTQCSVSQSNSHLSCCLCPIKGGAMKATTDATSWAHLVCALFVPEVFFKDPDGRDGIDCSKVPRRRWEESCYVCKSRKGCVIECSEPKCPLAFHATCGLNQDLCFEYRQGKKNKATIVAAFCKTHTQLWKTQQHTGKFRIVARE